VKSPFLALFFIFFNTKGVVLPMAVEVNNVMITKPFFDYKAAHKCSLKVM